MLYFSRSYKTALCFEQKVAKNKRILGVRGGKRMTSETRDPGGEGFWVIWLHTVAAHSAFRQFTRSQSS